MLEADYLALQTVIRFLSSHTLGTNQPPEKCHSKPNTIQFQHLKYYLKLYFNSRWKCPCDVSPKFYHLYTRFLTLQKEEVFTHGVNDNCGQGSCRP